MKFHESHFEEYVHSSEKQNLHTTFDKILKKFPTEFKDLKNDGRFDTLERKETTSESLS